MGSLKDYVLMSDFYPKCDKCGSVRLSRYEDVTAERPTQTEDGTPLLWLGNALLMKHYVCLDCGANGSDWDDVQVDDERLLP